MEKSFFRFLDRLSCDIHKNIPQIHNQFYAYQQLVIQYGEKFNLISQSDFKVFAARHLIDSLMVVSLYPQEFHNSKMKVVDVGTGSGLPGIPLAILFPEMQVTLIDSNHKKAVFLENFVKPQLSLHNISVFCSRAEDLINNTAYSRTYDLGISRAAANLPLAIDWIRPLLKEDGECAFWISSSDWEQKYKNLKFPEKHHVSLVGQKDYKLDVNKDLDRKIVLFRSNFLGKGQ